MIQFIKKNKTSNQLDLAASAKFGGVETDETKMFIERMVNDMNHRDTKINGSELLDDSVSKNKSVQIEETTNEEIKSFGPQYNEDKEVYT